MRYVRAALICLVCSLAMAFPVRAEGGKTSFFDSINAVLSGFDIGIGGTVITSEYKDTKLAGSTLPLLGYEGEHFYLRGVSGGLHLFRTSWFELNAQLFALSFNAVADRQIVRIVDLQLLLVAVDSQNMVLVDCTCLEFTGTTGLILQLFGDLENAMFRLFFHIQCRIVI